MYAVIFKATFKASFLENSAQLKDEYSTTATRMRELATTQYGCLELSACTEGGQEIAISYWPSQDHIKRWKQDKEHLAAQALGQSKWYESYQVQVVEVMREYNS